MTDDWYQVYDADTACAKIDDNAEKAKAAIRARARLYAPFTAAAKRWKANGHQARFDLSTILDGSYGYLVFVLGVHDELGLAEPALTELFGELVAEGGWVIDEVTDVTDTMFIGKGVNIKREGQIYAPGFFHCHVKIGRYDWGENTDGAACQRRQVGTLPVKEQVVTYKTIDKPVYEVVCTGGPDGNLPG